MDAGSGCQIQDAEFIKNLEFSWKMQILNEKTIPKLKFLWARAIRVFAIKDFSIVGS